MIRLEEVSKRFDGTLAVDRLTLEVKEGEVCVLIGPSGCGKTTTLRMINRLVEPTSGNIFLDGTNTLKLKPEKLRLSIGYAIQNVGLFPHMTVAENIAIVPQLVHWPKNKIRQRTEELLRLVGLNPKDYINKYPNSLSGGEAQRIGVARALAANPPILLMDEPFGAVDPLTRGKLQSQFIQIQHELKKTVIFVTHDLDEAIRLADRIAIMSTGKLVQYDSPHEILTHPVNNFVRDFVGTDRALKKLSRIPVSEYMKPIIKVTVNQPFPEAIKTMGNRSYIWVTDNNGRLLGWLDKRNSTGATSVEEAMTKEDIETAAVPSDATLREALSHILDQGFHSLPVVTEENKLIGEVTLREIETAVTAEEDATQQ